MFKKKALTTAVQAAMVVSAATLMQGCNLAEEKSTSKVSGIFEQVRAPKGTVMGVVQDTNGNPLQGVKVVLGSKTTRTNAGGQYQFNGVAVVNTVNLDDETGHEAIQVTVVAPEGYLGATVTVYPQAQIDGMDNADTNTQDQTGNQVTTFIDGYTASAGTAVLPMLDATVSGTLRNSVTGETIGQQLVSLDFEQTNRRPAGQEQSHDGVNYSYATGNYSTTTDGNGNFTITNVPNDSCSRFVVGGYAVNSLDANSCSSTSVGTNDEVDFVDVGDLLVTEIKSADQINPYVIAVSNLATPNGTMLDRGINGTQGIVITLSEPLRPTSDTEIPTLIRVTSGAGEYVGVVNNSAVLSTDGRTLTVTTTSAIPDGASFQIYIAEENLNDIAGNNIDNGAGDPGEWPNDSINNVGVGGSSNLSYLIIPLQMWQEENLNAEATSDEDQLATDDLGVDQNTTLSALGLPAFNDVDDTDVAMDVDQLNYQGDNVDDFDAEDRLQDLADAILGAVGVTSPDIDTDVARVRLTAHNASKYEMIVSRGGVALDGDGGDYTATFPTLAGSAIDVNGDDNYEFQATADEVVEIVIDGVRPGDKVQFIPYDGLGYMGVGRDVDLDDNVEPTTALQNAYGEGDHEGSDTSSYGDGAELSYVGSINAVPTPNLNITVGTLDIDCGTGAANLGCDNLQHELLDHNTTPEDVGLVGEDAYITVANLYDANAYQTFITGNLSRTIGVAFTENLASLSADPTYTGAADLSNFVILNDVSEQDDADGTDADLIVFNVDNIMTLANTDGDGDGTVLSFSNLITDLAGNTGTVADVVVRDELPPLIVDAVYTGERITITFSEDVVPRLGGVSYVALAGINEPLARIYLDDDTVNAHNASTNTDKHILNIPRANWDAGDIVTATVFDTGLYREEDAGTDYNHGRLTAGNIEDTSGNDALDSAASMTLPAFAIKDTLGAISVSFTPVSGYAIGNDTNIQLRISSNHRIDMQATFNGCASNTITQATTTLDGDDIAGCFTLNNTLAGTASIDNTDALTSATLSSDGKQLNIRIETTAILAAGDNFDVGTVVSLYDATDSADPSALTNL